MKSNQIILYSANNNTVKIEVTFYKNTFWLTQKRMSELFGVAVPAISKHLKNIFDSNELAQDAVVSILETTAADGKNYKTTFYRLEVVLAVGYRVNTAQATQFRIWATNILQEFIVKGFVMDDERLRTGQSSSTIFYNFLITQF